MLNASPEIAVLLTSHNRREKTVRCLSKLFRQIGIGSAFRLDVFLVDDGSSDGTAAAVKKNFPSVNIIKGTGNLFWNRGMILAWESAVKKKDYDFFLLLNDDTYLFSSAISDVLSSIEGPDWIVCGSTCSERDPDSVTYGGSLTGEKTKLEPTGKVNKCDYCNANFLLVSWEAYRKTGILDPVFHHAVGDYDYSFRASKMNIPCYIAPHYVGTCESHATPSEWISPELKLRQRWKALYTTSCECYPPHFFIYEMRHRGFPLACMHYVAIHLRVLMPSLWE